MTSWREHPHRFQQGCKYSQLHMSVRHDHEHERTEHNMSRLQPTHRRVGALPQSHPGLCGTPVGPGKDTHGTPVPGREGRGWPDTSSTKRPLTRDDHMADESKWRRPGSPRRSRRETKQIIQEKINHEIKIPQNQYNDKVVDVSVEMQRQFPLIQTVHRKSWGREPDK